MTTCNIFHLMGRKRIVYLVLNGRDWKTEWVISFSVSHRPFYVSTWSFSHWHPTWLQVSISAFWDFLPLITGCCCSNECVDRVVWCKNHLLWQYLCPFAFSISYDQPVRFFLVFFIVASSHSIECGLIGWTQALLPVWSWLSYLLVLCCRPKIFVSGWCWDVQLVCCESLTALVVGTLLRLYISSLVVSQFWLQLPSYH